MHASAHGRVADEVGVVGGAQQHMGDLHRIPTRHTYVVVDARCVRAVLSAPGLYGLLWAPNFFFETQLQT